MVLKNKDGKLCIKGSRADKEKRLTKEELENMLMNKEIMGSEDVMTRREARKIKYTEACKKLYEKKALVKDTEEIEKKIGFDCLDKDDTPWKELVRLAKKHHLNYKGTREELCERLKNIGYEFRDGDNNIEMDTIKCYKFKKNECEENVDKCTWLPQIVDRNNIESKRLLINRLKTLDKLNNRPSQDYATWTNRELKNKLEEYGLNKKGSSCIENPRTLDKLFLPDNPNEVDASLVSQEEQAPMNKSEPVIDKEESGDDNKLVIDEEDADKSEQSEDEDEEVVSNDEKKSVIDEATQTNDKEEQLMDKKVPKTESDFKTESKSITKEDCDDFIKIAVEEENNKCNSKLKETNDINENILNTEKKIFSEKLTQAAETIKKLEEELKELKTTSSKKASIQQEESLDVKKQTPKNSTVSDQLLTSLTEETTDNAKSTDLLEQYADSLTSSEEAASEEAASEEAASAASAASAAPEEDQEEDQKEDEEESAPEDQEKDKEESAPEDQEKNEEESAPEEEKKEAVAPAPEEEKKEAVTPAQEEEKEEAIAPSPEEEKKDAIAPAQEEEKEEAVAPSPEEATSAQEEEKEETVSPSPEEEKKEAVAPAPEEEKEEAVVSSPEEATPAPEEEKEEAVTSSPEEAMSAPEEEEEEYTLASTLEEQEETPVSENTDNFIEVVMDDDSAILEESEKPKKFEEPVLEESEQSEEESEESEQESLVKISSFNNNMVEPFDFSEDISIDVKIDFDPTMYTEIYSAA